MLFEALQQQDTTALAVCDGQHRLTRQMLLTEVAALAAQLQQLGIARLGLHVDNSLEWLLFDLAAMQARVVCVPLPTFFTPQQLAYVAEHCGLDAVVSSSAMSIPNFTVEASTLVGLLLQCRTVTNAVALPPQTGKVTFTSGSTGTPKGVCLSWPQQLQQAKVLAQAVGLTHTKHLCVLPLSTLLENIAGVYAPLLAGGSVEVCPLAALGFSGSRLAQPQQFLQKLSLSKPDTLILIPQLLQLLVGAVMQGWQPPALRYIAVGGSRVAPALLLQARKLGLPVYEGYGLSECTSVVSLNTPTHDQLGTAGKVLPHAKVTEVNGELVVSGNLMLGYVGDPASWHQSQFATGDVGTVDAEGFVRISGRSKNLLISSYGRNISPEWVESELLALPALAEAIVFGDAKPYCTALLSLRDPRLTDEQVSAMLAQVNQRLPDYAQIKRWQRLPAPLNQQAQLLTDNGKPKRAAVAQHYAGLIDSLYPAADISV